MSGLSDKAILEVQREKAMVDLTYQLLADKGEAMLYRDIVESVSSMKGFTTKEMSQYIAQLYTEINIDGRFVCVGRSLWGLKHWYPLDQTTDSAVAANVKDDDLEEELDNDFDDELDELEEDLED